MTLRIVNKPKAVAPLDLQWTLLVEQARENVVMAVAGEGQSETLFEDKLRIACPDGRCIEISWDSKTGLQIASVRSGGET